MTDDEQLIEELSESIASDLDYYDKIKDSWLKQNQEDFDDELVQGI